jgi:TetR/AcrR family transcriptional repressor of nem operon
MKISKETAAHHRAALLGAASALFRERGFAGVSIADIAAAAGLTHGVFYNHFASKEALCAEVVEQAIDKSREFNKAHPNRRARFEYYLSTSHTEDRAGGCPLAALSADVAREPRKVRAAFSRAADRMFDMLADEEPAGSVQARDRAIAGLATRVGALVLARAMSDPKLRDEILRAAKRAVQPPPPGSTIPLSFGPSKLPPANRAIRRPP